MLKTARDGLRGPPRLPRCPHACCLQVSRHAQRHGAAWPWRAGDAAWTRGEKQRASREAEEGERRRPGRGLALCAAGSPAEAARLCARSVGHGGAPPKRVHTPQALGGAGGRGPAPWTAGKRSPVGHRAEPRGPWVGRTSEEACVLVQAGEGGTHTQNQGEE